MTDDQQRARELRKQAAKILGDAYNAACFFGAADDALSDTPSPHCQVTITAITAALRAAPEGFVMVRVDELQRAIDVLRYGSHPQPSPHADVLAAVIAARTQGVK